MSNERDPSGAEAPEFFGGCDGTAEAAPFHIPLPHPLSTSPFHISFPHPLSTSLFRIAGDGFLMACAVRWK